MQPVLEFCDFGFKYTAQAEPTLYNINLSLRKGEKLLIAGPSGCGKSTLAHCINGLIPHSYRGEMTGSVRVAGRETRELGIFELSRHVGTVLQDSDGQFIGLTVAEDIAFALENDCVETQLMHTRVRKAARLVNIDGHLAHAPNELSGGQKQRAALAGVMVDDVELLLFDEPLANLDPAAGKQAIELIDEIQRETGAAVIIIEHRLEDVLHRHVDRVVLMEKGRLIADTSPAQLLSGTYLADSGIREPLYITALKYAGVEIRPQMQPQSIDTLMLADADKKRVRAWYDAAPEKALPDGQPELLRAADLSFTYDNGRTALSGVSVTARRGEMLAIVGANGAGKSTFAKLCCGFETPNSGVIYFDGADMSALSIKERADHIGYVMQNPNQMLSKVLIYDEIALGLRTRGVSEADIKPRVEETLKICGLWPFRSWPISALSYGQKKRVTIASILVLKPEIIFLDEPTAGQDLRHYTEIMDFLSELNRQGTCIILITHDMHLMLEYASRAVVFSEGRVIRDADCAAVLTDMEVIRRASLRETSLYALAGLCGIDDRTGFVRRFIDCERERRAR